MISLREEQMSDAMTKFHVEGLPRSAVFHRFTAPDTGPAHDHPFGFQSVILSGGYIEERFHPITGQSRFIQRKQSDSFFVSASSIHRIVRLSDPEVWTLILPGHWEQKSGFWEFREDGPYYRPWDRPDFQRVEVSS